MASSPPTPTTDVDVSSVPTWPDLPDEGAVHVWLLSTSGPTRFDPGMLDRDEARRLRGLVGSGLRNRFLAAHAGLRTILSRYLNIAPEEVSFIRDLCASCGRAHGKPRLSRAHQTSVTFSLARTRNIAVVAVGVRVEVGVDAEWLDLTIELEPLTCWACTATERAGLLSLPPEARIPAFFAWWTRKEAYVKLRGEGVPSFDEFEVLPPPARPSSGRRMSRVRGLTPL